MSWPALNRMHSVNVALAKHARAHFARRCILQSGLAIATCEELLESSTCAALRTICYPADVSQRVTPHMRQRPGRLAPADAPLSPCLPTDLRWMLQREPATVAATSLAAVASAAIPTYVARTVARRRFLPACCAHGQLRPPRRRFRAARELVP